MSGYVKWDVHLCIVATRQGLYKPRKLATCYMCGPTVTPRYYTRDCPLDFFRVAMHAQLALAVPDFVLCWSINCVSPACILIFYGNSLFGIVIGPSAIAGPLAYPNANLGLPVRLHLQMRGCCSVEVSHVVPYNIC